jgi:hypothetical protein
MPKKTKKEHAIARIEARRANKKRRELRKACDEEKVTSVLRDNNSKKKSGAYRYAYLAYKPPKGVRPEVWELASKIKYDWIPVRTLENWKPRGKSFKSQFWSVVEHLLCKYPMQKFWLNVFSDYSGIRQTHTSNVLRDFFARVAKGDSPYKVAKETIRTPLTKKMCHLLMTYKGTEHPMKVIRICQVKAYGGPDWLASAINRTSWGEDLSFEDNVASAIDWLCRQKDLTPEQVTPFIDYISDRFTNDRNYSLSGRTVSSMTKAVTDWHAELAKKAGGGAVFKSSGHKSEVWLIKDKYSEVEEMWEMVEILTGRDLAKEGRSLRHCVYSYKFYIENGTRSIWSLRKGNEPQVTVEVDNTRKYIVQVRGKFNRPSTSEERKLVKSWAQTNNLTIDYW